MPPQLFYQRKPMLIVSILLVVSLAWALFQFYRDAKITATGVKSGVAVEGNGLIVRLVGNKPTFLQQVFIEVPIRLAVFGFGFIRSGDDYPRAFTALAIGGLVAYGFKNLQGHARWVRLGVK